MNATVHYAEVYENYQLIGWRWSCSCGAHSTKPAPTNKAVVKLGGGHLHRKHS